ncbi:MAG: hypothetical protein AAF533_30285, partial [Acidobacteriota bacterium]
MRSGLVILSFLLSMPSGSLLAQALDPPAEPAEPSEPAPRRWMDRDRSASARREASVPATSTASTERSPGVRSGRRAIRTRAAGGPVDPCLVPGLIYASTMDELWVIDPDTLEATFLGPLPEETFDVGVTPDGRLIVSSNRGAEIHAIDTCDLSSTFLGALTESVNSIGPGLGPGLVLAPASSRLLELEVTATSVITTPVLPSDGWCSVPSGDAALSPCVGRLQAVGADRVTGRRVESHERVGRGQAEGSALRARELAHVETTVAGAEGRISGGHRAPAVGRQHGRGDHRGRGHLQL